MFVYISLFFTILNQTLESSAIADYNGTLVHDIFLGISVCSAVVAIAFNLKKFSIYEIIPAFLIYLVAGLCFLFSQNTGLILLVISLTVVLFADTDRILRFVLIEKVSLCLLIAALALFGVLDNSLVSISKAGYYIKAYKLGFAHPNVLACEICSMIILFLCCFRRSINAWKILLCIAIDVGVFFLTGSRTGCILTLAASLFAPFLRFERLKKLLLKILPFVFPAIAGLVVLMLALYSNYGADYPFTKFIDHIMNGRIRMGCVAIDAFGPTAFGEKLDISFLRNEHNITIDNGQVAFYISYGIVGSLAYFVLVGKIVACIKKKKEAMFALAFIVFFLWSMYEGTMLFIGKNFIFLTTTLLFTQRSHKVYKKFRVASTNTAQPSAIPKKIHYCWFGKTPLKKQAKECIASWKKHFPDYEIVEWNEENFDINDCDYVREAYESKKWAFVSDYARFYILYNEGGIYFDTDVEVIGNFNEIIEKGPYMGLEDEGKINPGLGMAAQKGNPLLREILDGYKKRRFLNEKGEPDYTTVVDFVTQICEKQGTADFTIYEKEYFCPYDYVTGKLKITDKTRSIHHYEASWIDPLMQKIVKKEKRLKLYLGDSLGEIVGKILTAPLKLKYKYNIKKAAK